MLMASNLQLPSFRSPLLRNSSFLGQITLSNFPHKSSAGVPRSPFVITAMAKFNLSEIMGGRGLCNGEAGLQQELKKTVSVESTALSTGTDETFGESDDKEFPEDAFEKELLGLTGGFPGGEKGLKKFIEQNPPPKKKAAQAIGLVGVNQSLAKKPKAPELPLLLPGMIAIVKNPNSPFYMYCGIVQRITDGKAGVLFEGGNWDRLITFRLEELERRQKGPPMVNPKSCILESNLEKSSL